jgi:hypothetical protein
MDENIKAFLANYCLPSNFATLARRTAADESFPHRPRQPNWLGLSEDIKQLSET